MPKGCKKQKEEKKTAEAKKIRVITIIDQGQKRFSKKET